MNRPYPRASQYASHNQQSPDWSTFDQNRSSTGAGALGIYAKTPLVTVSVAMNVAVQRITSPTGVEWL